MSFQVEHAFVNTLVSGDLSSLNWIESEIAQTKLLPLNKNLCHVHYAALNFRDVMKASGKLPRDSLPSHLVEQVLIKHTITDFNNELTFVRIWT